MGHLFIIRAPPKKWLKGFILSNYKSVKGMNAFCTETLLKPTVITCKRLCVASRDYRREDKKHVHEARGRHWCHFNSLFQKYPIVTQTKKKKPNRLSNRCIWIYRFQARVRNRQILNQGVESQLFTCLCNRFHQWLSDIEIIKMSSFWASYSRNNTGFTAGNQTEARHCHATCGHS